MHAVDSEIKHLHISTGDDEQRDRQVDTQIEAHWAVHNDAVIGSLEQARYIRQYTNHHWFREWLVAWLVPSHYLNQWWNIVNRTLRNKLQWNFNKNSYIFIEENAFENVVWKMVSIFLGLNVLNAEIPSAA